MSGVSLSRESVSRVSLSSNPFCSRGVSVQETPPYRWASGQYASYWNAFFLKFKIKKSFTKKHSSQGDVCRAII